MITPRFRLSQTDAAVTVTVRAPYGSLKDAEVTVEDNLFLFLSSPYYLRLHLPGRLVEDGSASSFDSDSGEFTFALQKATPGEHFPDLDLVTKLLCPKVEAGTEDGEMIQVLTSEGAVESTDSPDDDGDADRRFGFALRGHRQFNYVSSEFRDVLEADPRTVDLEERRRLRLKHEQETFCPDHYLADFVENDEILELIDRRSPWADLTRDQVTFTDAELDLLKDLPNRDFGLTDAQLSYCHCCLLDILYGYCYDRRVTQFEGSCESGWNIIKISASLSWLDAFAEPRDGVVSAFRRSLIYPLYRSFELSQAVFGDLKQLLRLGEKFIVKCLIDMHGIFLGGGCCRYIINNLFVKDYIVYVMKWDKERWAKVVGEVEKLTILKSDLGLGLSEIEDGECAGLGAFVSLRIAEDDSDDTDSDDDSSDSSE